MLGMIKKVFFVGLTILSCINPLNATLLECISMTNPECKVRPETGNVTSNEPVFYHFGIKTSKCGGSCNNSNDPYAKTCIPDAVGNSNVKVYYLMSRTNEKNTHRMA